MPPGFRLYHLPKSLECDLLAESFALTCFREPFSNCFVGVVE